MHIRAMVPGMRYETSETQLPPRSFESSRWKARYVSDVIDLPQLPATGGGIDDKAPYRIAIGSTDSQFVARRAIQITELGSIPAVTDHRKRHAIDGSIPIWMQRA